MIKVAVAVVAVLSCAPTFADDVEESIGMHLGSYHSPAKDYNNVNPGFYVRTEDGMKGGLYHNSHKRLSIYVVREWQFELPYDWRAGLSIGGVTGYKLPVTPLIAPTLYTPEYNNFRLGITYFPKVEESGSHIIHLGVERKQNFL